MELVDGQQEGQLEAPPFGLFFLFSWLCQNIRNVSSSHSCGSDGLNNQLLPQLHNKGWRGWCQGKGELKILRAISQNRSSLLFLQHLCKEVLPCYWSLSARVNFSLRREQQLAASFCWHEFHVAWCFCLSTHTFLFKLTGIHREWYYHLEQFNQWKNQDLGTRKSWNEPRLLAGPQNLVYNWHPMYWITWNSI